MSVIQDRIYEQAERARPKWIASSVSKGFNRQNHDLSMQTQATHEAILLLSCTFCTKFPACWHIICLTYKPNCKPNQREKQCGKMIMHTANWLSSLGAPVRLDKLKVTLERKRDSEPVQISSYNKHTPNWVVCSLVWREWMDVWGQWNDPFTGIVVSCEYDSSPLSGSFSWLLEPILWSLFDQRRQSKGIHFYGKAEEKLKG